MFKCSNCNSEFLKWSGKCLNCESWNTLEEIVEVSNSKSKSRKISGNQVETFKIIDSQDKIIKYSLSSQEFNTVIGGGITPGSLTLLSGEPGIGKSTLSLQIANWFANADKKALYISSEENIHQLSSRATRLGIQNQNIEILNSSNLEDIIKTISNNKNELVIIDSISIISSFDLSSTSGSVSQIKYITENLMEIAKTSQKAIIIIGHVTKDGSISGPKVLEHLVDTVLFLEGSKYENYRILRSLKNRFGPTDEVGLFKMGSKGLEDLANPAGEFINKDQEKLSGSALAMTIEGTRPILVEIEALTTYTKFGYPKRSARGMSSGKLDLLIAVITKFTAVKLESYDVYVNIARGLNITEPGIDLATITAIISSKNSRPLGKTIFIGEVSLTGVVKKVFNIEKRIDEAIKLGFDKIIIPQGVKTKKSGNSELIEIGNIGELEKII